MQILLIISNLFIEAIQYNDTYYFSLDEYSACEDPCNKYDKYICLDSSDNERCESRKDSCFDRKRCKYYVKEMKWLLKNLLCQIKVLMTKTVDTTFNSLTQSLKTGVDKLEADLRDTTNVLENSVLKGVDDNYVTLSTELSTGVVKNVETLEADLEALILTSKENSLVKLNTVRALTDAEIVTYIKDVNQAEKDILNFLEKLQNSLLLATAKEEKSLLKLVTTVLSSTKLNLTTNLEKLFKDFKKNLLKLVFKFAETFSSLKAESRIKLVADLSAEVRNLLQRDVYLLFGIVNKIVEYCGYFLGNDYLDLNVLTRVNPRYY